MNNILRKILLVGLLLIIGCSTQSENELSQIEKAPDLKPILEEYQKKIKKGGIVVSYQKKGQDAPTSQTIGVSHGDVKLAPDMLFAAASNTKTFTAVLIILLAEQGKLKLSDTIDKHITKSYNNIDPKITISQLLNHSSGLADYVNIASFTKILLNPSKIYTVEDILKEVPAKISNPGTKFAYSSTNYILLGMIIEKVSGKTYLEYLKENIINKLSMKHTFLEGKETVKGTLAHSHFFIGDGNASDVGTMNRNGLSTAAWSAGALVTKPSEMIIFYKALFEGKLVSEKSLKQMKTPVNNDLYGYGLQKISKDGVTFYGHGGQTVAFESIMAYEPDTQTILCAYINSGLYKKRFLQDLVKDVFLKIK